MKLSSRAAEVSDRNVASREAERGEGKGGGAFKLISK